MLNYMRNKVMSVARVKKDRLCVYGILDDDLYGLWIKVGVDLPGMKILSLEAGWNRWTTPECRLALEPLQEAVGMRIEPGLRQKVQKSISRKACRHFANLLLECCHAAREAAELIREQDQEIDPPLEGGSGDEKKPAPPPLSGDREKVAPQRDEKPRISAPSAGITIDLHVHTSKGSPCSSAPVDGLIEEARRIGLGGICLTDHNYLWRPERVEDLRRKHDFLVLSDDLHYEKKRDNGKNRHREPEDYSAQQQIFFRCLRLFFLHVQGSFFGCCQRDWIPVNIQ